MNETHVVQIELVQGNKEKLLPKYRVEPAKVMVSPGDTLEFYSNDAESKISFPDSGIIENEGCWKTIEKGNKIVIKVKTSVKNTYYYAVMCKHNEEEYWYAEGNTCPAMIVK
jgi:plastocyanin